MTSSLQEAKANIRANPGNPTNYLQAGDILIEMKRQKAALDIYEYGLKRVKHVGKAYERLKKCHDDLLAELAPNTAVDPLTMLPRELAVSILDSLTFRERVVVRRVSKGWNQFIRSEPTLWTHLDLSTAHRKKVTTKFIATAINTAKSKLSAATLSQLFDFDKTLAALLRSCPLEVLNLAQTGLQGTNLLQILAKEKQRLRLRELRVLRGTEMSQTTLREASATCQTTLEVLYCWQIKSLAFTSKWNTLAFPKLRVIDITADQITGLGDPGLKQLLNASPQLTSLTLINKDYAHYESIAQLDLEGTILEHIHLQLCLPGTLQLPGSVRSLHLIPIGASNTSLSAISPPLSQELRSLGIRRVDITQNSTMETLSKLVGLRDLALLEVVGLGDSEIIGVVKALPQLKLLDVSGSNITGAGIADIVRIGRITDLVVRECHKISHRDAIDFARARGVKVTNQ